MNAQQPGKIITFYSYKGGTGRSMALANVAWILASQGKRVLLVDWDLEAPGLHRYFHPFIQDKNLTSSDGLIEMVMKFEDAAINPGDGKSSVENPSDSDHPSTAAPANPDWYLPLAELDGFTIPLNWSFPHIGVLDLIPAGKQGMTYAARVNSFNWSGFYDRLGGGVFLEAVKRNMRQKYDYILIDSRTGVSDTAGVCTVQMPDILVVCFTYNIQSIEGAAAVAGSIRAQRDKGITNIGAGKPLRIFPVPMRVERGGDKERLNRARELAQSAFSGFLDHLVDGKADKYWGQIDIPYDPFYAFQEILATVADHPGVRDSVLTACEQLASFLTDGEITEQVVLPAEDRNTIKQLFLLGAQPRSIRDVLTKNPELEIFCDLASTRQKSWVESKGRDEYLLDAKLIDRLQSSTELFIPLLQEKGFREFWDASQKHLRRAQLRDALAPRAFLAAALGIFLIPLAIDQLLAESCFVKC
jgi:MinD-like ATPase involved in chromosome partitioning or flagellar assembly